MTETSELLMSCCVNNCTSVAGVDGVVVFPFPTILTNLIQKRLWIQAIQRTNGILWYPKRTSGVCSEHFISKEPHADRGHPDYAPSVFNYDDSVPVKRSNVTLKQFALEYIRYDDLLLKQVVPEKKKRAYNLLAESLHISVNEVMEWEVRLRNLIQKRDTSQARYEPHKTYTQDWVNIVEHKLKTVQAFRENKEPATPVGPGHVILALREAAAARGMLWSEPHYHDVCRALRLPVTYKQLKIVWEKAQQASLSELTLSSRMGDWPSFAATQVSTNISDLVLLLTDVDRHRIVNDESIFLYEEAKALQFLMDLIRIHRCEGDLPKRVRAQRWTRVHKDYLQSGRVASLVALQRRWHELALQARTRLASYWRRTRVRHTYTQASDATQKYLPFPAPIHIEILKRYPHIALKPFTRWRKLVASGVIIQMQLGDEAVSQPESELPTTPTTRGITSEHSYDKTQSNNIDKKLSMDVRVNIDNIEEIVKNLQTGSSVNISEINTKVQRNTNNNNLNKNQDVVNANDEITVHNESVDTALNSNLVEDMYNNIVYEISIPSPIDDNNTINENFGDLNKTVDYNINNPTVHFNIENQAEYYNPIDTVAYTTLNENIGGQYYVYKDQLLSTQFETLSDVSEDEFGIDNSNKMMVSANNGNNNGTRVATGVDTRNIDEISQVNSNVTTQHTPFRPRPRYRDLDNPARAPTVPLDLGTLSPNEGISEVLRNTEIMLKQKEQEVDFIIKMPTEKQLESLLAELAFASREQQGMVHKRCCLARHAQAINDERARRGDPPLRIHEHKDEKCNCCCQYLCGRTMNIKQTADRMALCDEIIAMIQKKESWTEKASSTALKRKLQTPNNKTAKTIEETIAIKKLLHSKQESASAEKTQEKIITTNITSININPAAIPIPVTSVGPNPSAMAIPVPSVGPNPVAIPIPVTSVVPNPSAIPIPVTAVGPNPSAIPIPVTSVVPNPSAIPIPVTSVGPNPSAIPIPVTAVGPLNSSLNINPPAIPIPFTSVGIKENSVYSNPSAIPIPVTPGGPQTTSFNRNPSAIPIPFTSVGPQNSSHNLNPSAIPIPVTAVGPQNSSLNINPPAIPIPFTSVGIKENSVYSNPSAIPIPVTPGGPQTTSFSRNPSAIPIPFTSVGPQNSSHNLNPSAIPISFTSVGPQNSFHNLNPSAIPIPFTSEGPQNSSHNLNPSAISIPSTSVGPQNSSVNSNPSYIPIPSTSVGPQNSSVNLNPFAIPISFTSVVIKEKSVYSNPSAIPIPVTSAGPNPSAIPIPVTSVGPNPSAIPIPFTPVGPQKSSVNSNPFAKPISFTSVVIKEKSVYSNPSAIPILVTSVGPNPSAIPISFTSVGLKEKSVYSNPSGIPILDTCVSPKDTSAYINPCPIPISFTSVGLKDTSGNRNPSAIPIPFTSVSPKDTPGNINPSAISIPISDKSLNYTEKPENLSTASATAEELSSPTNENNEKFSNDSAPSEEISMDTDESAQPSSDAEIFEESSTDSATCETLCKDIEKLLKDSVEPEKTLKSSANNESLKDSNKLEILSKASTTLSKEAAKPDIFSKDSSKSENSTKDSDKSEKSTKDSSESEPNRYESTRNSSIKSSRDSFEALKSANNSTKSNKSSNDSKSVIKPTKSNPSETSSTKYRKRTRSISPISSEARTSEGDDVHEEWMRQSSLLPRRSRPVIRPRLSVTLDINKPSETKKSHHDENESSDNSVETGTKLSPVNEESDDSTTKTKESVPEKRFKSLTWSRKLSTSRESSTSVKTPSKSSTAENLSSKTFTSVNTSAQSSTSVDCLTGLLKISNASDNLPITTQGTTEKTHNSPTLSTTSQNDPKPTADNSNKSTTHVNLVEKHVQYGKNIEPEIPGTKSTTNSSVPTLSNSDGLPNKESDRLPKKRLFSVDENKAIDLNKSKRSTANIENLTTINSKEKTSSKTRDGRLTETTPKNATQTRFVSIFEPVDINKEVEKIKSPDINGTWSMVLNSDSDEDCIIIDSDLNRNRIHESIYTDSGDENPNTNSKEKSTKGSTSESRTGIKTVPELRDKKYYTNLIKKRLKSECIDCLGFKVTTSPKNPKSIELQKPSRSTNMLRRQSTIPVNNKAMEIESTRHSSNRPTERRKSFDVTTTTTKTKWIDQGNRMLAKKKPTKISPSTSYKPIEKNISSKTAGPEVVSINIDELTIKRIRKECIDLSPLSDDSDIEIVEPEPKKKKILMTEENTKTIKAEPKKSDKIVKLVDLTSEEIEDFEVVGVATVVNSPQSDSSYESVTSDIVERLVAENIERIEKSSITITDSDDDVNMSSKSGPSKNYDDRSSKRATRSNSLRNRSSGRDNYSDSRSSGTSINRTRSESLNNLSSKRTARAKSDDNRSSGRHSNSDRSLGESSSNRTNSESRNNVSSERAARSKSLQNRSSVRHNYLNNNDDASSKNDNSSDTDDKANSEVETDSENNANKGSNKDNDSESDRNVRSKNNTGSDDDGSVSSESGARSKTNDKQGSKSDSDDLESDNNACSNNNINSENCDSNSSDTHSKNVDNISSNHGTASDKDDNASTKNDNDTDDEGTQSSKSATHSKSGEDIRSKSGNNSESDNNESSETNTELNSIPRPNTPSRESTSKDRTAKKSGDELSQDEKKRKKHKKKKKKNKRKHKSKEKRSSSSPQDCKECQTVINLETMESLIERDIIYHENTREDSNDSVHSDRVNG